MNPIKWLYEKDGNGFVNWSGLAMFGIFFILPAIPTMLFIWWLLKHLRWV